MSPAVKTYVETVRQANVRIVLSRAADLVTVELEGDADVVETIGYHPDGALIINIRSSSTLMPESGVS